jgi:hypothetical protein
MSFSTSWVDHKEHKVHKENNNIKEKSFVIFVSFVVTENCFAFEEQAVDT